MQTFLDAADNKRSQAFFFLKDSDVQFLPFQRWHYSLGSGNHRESALFTGTYAGTATEAERVCNQSVAVTALCERHPFRQCDGLDVTGAEADAAAVAALRVDHSGETGFGNTVVVPHLHTRQQLAAAATTVTDK